jgi:hypothetical protein
MRKILQYILPVALTLFICVNVERTVVLFLLLNTTAAYTHRARIHLDVNQYSIKAGDTVNMRRTYLDIAVNMSLLQAAVFPETIR